MFPGRNGLGAIGLATLPTKSNVITPQPGPSDAFAPGLRVGWDKMDGYRDHVIQLSELFILGFKENRTLELSGRVACGPIGWCAKNRIPRRRARSAKYCSIFRDDPAGLRVLSTWAIRAFGWFERFKLSSVQRQTSFGNFCP